jgi:pimeloyl-ACP methyl ester carboxylesterase
LGGFDQWAMIRGESLANPPLILLHGGPGFTEMRLFRHFNAPIEKSFTVVNWDQRGAGKSFDRKVPKSSIDGRVIRRRAGRCATQTPRKERVRAETSVTYFDMLTAPSKRLVWFDESGHEPFIDEPAKFNAAMAELVRPVVMRDRRMRSSA